MTANLPSRVGPSDPVIAPVTFILTGGRLITVRYHEPRAFQIFSARAQRLDGLRRRIHRADRASGGDGRSPRGHAGKIGRDVEHLPRDLPRPPKIRAPGPDIRRARGSGGRGILENWRQPSHVGSPGRVSEAGEVARQRGPRHARPAQDACARHQSLDRSRFVPVPEAHIPARCDARNDHYRAKHIIKIFSVAAVVFLPPTLIASIYGMNFA